MSETSQQDLPAENKFGTTKAPFTTTGAIVKRVERDAWVQCHGGGMLIAFLFTGSAKWDKPVGTNGASHPDGGAPPLKAGNLSRVYDFKKWTVTDSSPSAVPPRNQ